MADSGCLRGGGKKIPRAPAQAESCDKRIANRGQLIMFALFFEHLWNFYQLGERMIFDLAQKDKF